jgi:hypothetical protein
MIRADVSGADQSDFYTLILFQNGDPFKTGCCSAGCCAMEIAAWQREFDRSARAGCREYGFATSLIVARLCGTGILACVGLVLLAL